MSVRRGTKIHIHVLSAPDTAKSGRKNLLEYGGRMFRCSCGIPGPKDCFGTTMVDGKPGAQIQQG